MRKPAASPTPFPRWTSWPTSVPPPTWSASPSSSSPASVLATSPGEERPPRLLVSGLELDTVVLNSLLTLYAKCGDWPTADSLFRAMGEDKRDLVSWSTMISGAARGENLQPATAAALFCEMLDSGFRPNEFCFSGVLHACANAKLLPFGLAVFGFLIKAGYFAAGVCVGCALIDLFARNLDLRSARKVFDKMPNKNVVAWTQMISRCAQYGSPEEAVELFLEMELAGFSPDQFTLSGVISASTELGWFQLGRQLHARAAQLGLAGDVCVGCSLVDMYAKAPGETAMADSRKVFDRIAENNNVMSWTAIISGHVQRRQDQEALDLFRRMVVHGGSRPNQVTFSGVLRACGNVSDAAAGEQVYAQAVKAGVASINCVGNAFVAVYAKSGRMEEARRALDHLLEKNLISYGDGDSDSGEIGASALTFASLLSAAASVGATSKGRQLHGWLMKVGFCSDQGVCNSLISMYSRCGEVEDACKVFDGLDRRNVISLTAMIGGLAKHGLAEREMLRGECRPNEVTFIGVLSACAHAGMEEEAWRIFQAMRRDHGIEPRMEHYACMVDLLGRLGFLERAVVFIREMPVKPSALVWRALLGACKIHGDLKLGEEAAVKILQAEPADPAAYVLLSNIYAATGRWRAWRR
ncbi:unnamed protein product [Spirodela intermedia]|uniref:Uncharacterized protein n=1 Tax=Spirodela intermedia TaxID=51605 RepID=A0A7I8JTI1_SPIIN|nr:unnamed protein product [Spirodela intermedia]CAA6672923.1 unnamed protein product [Spirodela intermedia]